jgi:hypothetical protein
MYIGNDLQIAHPSYKIIDDISSGFNGSATSFALQVSGETPVPFPISTQQVMISVNGVVQEPDPNGSAGFKLLGSNIVFSSAPANGHAFFGVINAGADYVTAGSEFPDGSATAPSFTFQDDQDTGWFRSGSGAVGFSANGVNTIGFDGNGLTVTGDATFTGDSSKNMFWDKSDGALEFADNAKATFGTGGDLTLRHNGTDTYVDNITGNFYIRGGSNSIHIRPKNDENSIVAASDGAVELYFDNSKKLSTASFGVQFEEDVQFPSASDNNALTWDKSEHTLEWRDNVKASWGDGKDLQILHDGTDSYVKHVLASGFLKLAGDGIKLQSDTSDEVYIRADHNAGVELYYDNSKTLQTQSGGVRVFGDLENHNNNFVAKDNCKFTAGNSSDLQIYHNGSDNFIDTFWNLTIRKDNGAETLAKFNNNGAVELYHDNVKTFETYSTGSIIRGAAGGDGELQLYADAGTANADCWRLKAESGAAELDIGNYASGSWEANIRCYANNAVDLYYDNSVKLATKDYGILVTGEVRDSKGDLRKIIQNTQGSSYTLVAADAGKHILASGTVTVPNSVFSAGDAVTIVNNTGSNLTITKSISTMYNASDGSSANRTLATRGMATILFISGTVSYISGSGLS